MAELSPAQLTALASEINTDPKTVGYTPGSKTNVQIAALLNTQGAGTTPTKVNAGIVSVQSLLNSLVGTEVVALSPAASAALLIYFSSGSLDTSNANVRSGIAAIFGVGTTSRANLLNAVDRFQSRGEVLFGNGVVIEDRHVSLALNRAV